MRQQPGRANSGRARRRAARRSLGRVRRIRRRVARGALGRIRLGTAGTSPRLRRWVLAAVLLAVAVVPYPTLGATGAPPAPPCRAGCRAGAVPSMVRWITALPGSWDVASGLAGTVPASGLAYAAAGGGIAAVGAGLTVYGYSARTGALQWQDTLTGFPAGAAIVSVRAWPGEVTAGVSYRPPGGAPRRTEVVITDSGTQTGRYPAAAFGGAVAGGPRYTVVVGATSVTSYDNATGHVRWRLSTGPVAQAWHTDGNWLYVTESAGGFVGSAPVTALRRVDLATGSEIVVKPLESLSFDGLLSAASDGVVLFSAAGGVTAYSGITGAQLWFARGAVPEGTDKHPSRIYLTEGSNLVGVDPQTGRVKATASGSAVNGAAGVYVVRGGVALGLDQGENGDAWGYDLAVQRVTLAAAGLPWPHYFVDLGGVGGSADPASNLVVIAACAQLAPSSPVPGSPAPGSPAGSTSPGPGSPAEPASPSSPAQGSPAQGSPAQGSPAVPGSPAGSTSPASLVSPASGALSGGPAPGVTPSASAGSGQGCLRPELVALNL